MIDPIAVAAITTGVLGCWFGHLVGFTKSKLVQAENIILAAENEKLNEDAERLNWIVENYEGHRGPEGTFDLRLRIPHDLEDGGLRYAIDVAMGKEASHD